MTRVLFVANWDWVLAHFRLPLARRLRDEDYEVLMCCPPGEYVRELRQAGFEWIPWQLERRSMSVLRELRSLREMALLVEQQQPNVVHAFTIKPVVYLSVVVVWRSLRRAAQPRLLINNLTGLGYLFSEELSARMVCTLLWPLLVVCLRQPRAQTVLMNDGDRRYLAGMQALPAGRTQLIRGTGVDTARFTPPAGDPLYADDCPDLAPSETTDSPSELTRPSSGRAAPTFDRATPTSGRAGVRPKVLFAGRLLKSKGVMEFIQAARELREYGDDAEFLLAGTPDPGNPETVAPDAAQAWHVDGLVTWLGHVTDMVELLSCTDVVVLPSHYEGLPRILLEGAAAGCGLVASDIDGCREVIDHGRNGLLVPPQEPDVLAAAIHHLLEHPREREQLATEARREAVARFDLEAINDQWIDLYRGCLQRR